MDPSGKSYSSSKLDTDIVEGCCTFLGIRRRLDDDATAGFLMGTNTLPAALAAIARRLFDAGTVLCNIVPLIRTIVPIWWNVRTSFLCILKMVNYGIYNKKKP